MFRMKRRWPGTSTKPRSRPTGSGILALKPCRTMMIAMTQAAVPQIETAGKPSSATFVAFVKRDCPTCALALPALRQIDEMTGRSGGMLEIHVQDDVRFA